jgi:sulfate/thiosulfate transport system substrate-binding protein
MHRRFRAAVLTALVASLGLAACGGDNASSGSAAATAPTAVTTAPSSTSAGGSATSGAPTAAAVVDPDAGKNVKLALVAYSVPQAANDAAEKAFAATAPGKKTSFDESYGASGDQSRAVAAGLKADYVHFSLSPDMDRLTKAGLVADDWSKGPTKGIVSQSVVAIAVRKGNPKGIKTWDDLIKPGIGIVSPNPSSSGSARWNILAAYGHVLAAGGSDADAQAYLTKFFQNVVALPGSGRDATTAFSSGTGDVLISYENEAIFARQQGVDLDYVVPDTTLLIENPGAVTKSAPPRAQLWLDYLLSPAGQAEYMKKGFRSVVPGVTGVQVQGANDPANPFPTPAKLLTIDKDFGGWSAATAKYFDATNGIVTRIQASTGKK